MIGTDEVRRRIDEAPSPVSGVLLPARQINHLDSTASVQLATLTDELRGRGIRLSFAEVKSTLLEMMRRTDLEEKLGPDNFYESTAEGVRAFLQGQGS